MDAEQELAAAVDIAREAADLVRSYFSTDRVDTRPKGDRDVVTAADLASERLILERLAERFPADGIVGEEGAATRPESGRRWYVDPLDGTLNFSRGLPVWCVSLALFDHGGPVLGVIVDPIRDETFSASTGNGAWLNGQRLCTSSVNRIGEAVAHMTVDFHEQSMLEGLRDIQVVAPMVLRTRNIGSAALALAYVACGRFDAMLHRYAHAWDYGAGVVLVLEAGGKVTDMVGSRYTEQTFALVATSSPPLHGELLTMLQAGPPTRIE